MQGRDDFLALSDAQFSDVMEGLDETLRSQKIAVSARAMKGWLDFSHTNKLALVMSEPLSKRILNWFTRRYGEREKVDFIHGKIPLIIKGDVLLMNIPMLWGKVAYEFNSKTIGAAGGPIGPDFDQKRGNFFDLIEGMTPYLRQSTWLI